METIKKISKENKKNPILEFFWFCSGANVDILRCCPTDHSKYFGIGGTILFTAMMAAFAGGYAFFTAFKDGVYQIINGQNVLVGYTLTSIILSVFFGIFWGSMIFNFDRYIVVTLGKGDGTSKITPDELRSAAPRLVMALLIGFVIATPLELKLFEKEINVEIESIINEEVEKLGRADTTKLKERNKLEIEKIGLSSKKDQINKGSYIVLEDIQSSGLSVQVNQINAKIAHEKGIIKPLYNCRTKSDTIRTNNWNRPIIGEIRKLKQQLSNLMSKVKSLSGSSDEIKKIEIAKIDVRIIEIDSRIKELNSIINSKTTERESVAKQYNGFMARIEAYDRLQSKYISLRIVGIFITILFIFIEVAPVFFKLMTESGPYDDMFERIKHEVSVREKQKISDVNDLINCDIEISTKKNLNRLSAEIKANEDLLNAIAVAQVEIASIAIDEWKKHEIKKAIENPECFIKSTTTDSNS